MKLSNSIAKLTSGIKSHAVTTLAAATLAGALFTVATPAAHAQFGIGVVIGGPRHYAPPPPPPPHFWGYRPYGYGRYYEYHPDYRGYYDRDRWARERYDRERYERDRDIRDHQYDYDRGPR